jgi:hypothetical protein
MKSKTLLGKAIDFLATKFLSNAHFLRLRDWLKNVVNSFRIPPLLSFFITKSGTINPTLEESLKDAPEAKDNWERLGMEDKAIGNLPRWSLFVALCIIVVLHSWSDIARTAVTTFSNFMLSTLSFPNGAALPFKYAMDGLIYIIDFFAKFGALFPLAVIFYFLIKSWGEKK